MSYHTKISNKIKNVKKHEKSVIERFQFTKDIDENCLSTSFSHIFQGDMQQDIIATNGQKL